MSTRGFEVTSAVSPMNEAFDYSAWVGRKAPGAIAAHHVVVELQRRADELRSIDARTDALFEFLDARGLVVNDEQRDRILDTEDLETIKRWVRRAATITRTEELFE